jgi:hypothetical protein
MSRRAFVRGDSFFASLSAKKSHHASALKPFHPQCFTYDFLALFLETFLMLPKKTINWTLPYKQGSFYRHSKPRVFLFMNAVGFSRVPIPTKLFSKTQRNSSGDGW